MLTAEMDELNAICSNSHNSQSGKVNNRNLEHNAWEMDIDDILTGADTINISHARGEFASVVDIADVLLGSTNQ